LSANQLMSLDFSEVINRSSESVVNRFARRDTTMEQFAREHGLKNPASWVLTLNGVLKQTPLVCDMREMLHLLHQAYDYPVDVEFTVNYFPDGGYRVNLVQCRPLQIQGGGMITDPPEDLDEQDVVLRAEGAVIGQCRLGHIDRLIYVVPSEYGQMPIRERYSIARLVGKLVQLERGEPRKAVMLMGPGRWGTTTPSLGVPVSFAEIDKVTVLCEIVAMRDDLVPDVSFGTHFFSDIVEMQILYLALFPERKGNVLNEGFLLKTPNKLRELLPNSREAFGRVVRVIDIADLPAHRQLTINANTLKQKVVCYLEKAEKATKPKPQREVAQQKV
jgi:pyruvate,water dikinase